MPEMSAEAPDRLFAKFQRTGDPRALAALFDATVAELHRVALYLTGDRHAADDVVQETFVAAIEARDQHRAGRRVLPWLLGILTNRAREHRRRMARPIDNARLLREDTPSAHDEAERRELEVALATALEGLPSPYREVMLLHARHGLRANEIAPVLGRPAGTVRTQVMRGMDMLRKSLPAGFTAPALIATTLLATASAGIAPRVRVAVLAHADRVAPPTALVASGLTALLGGIMGAKQVIGVASAVLLGAWCFTHWPGPDTDAVVPPSEALVPTARTTVLDRPTGADAPPAELRRDVVPPADNAIVPGRAELEFVWKDDGAPAVGVSFTVQRRPTASLGAFVSVDTWRTDEAGLVASDELEPGEYLLVWTGPMVAFELGSEQTVRRTIEITPAVVVEGRVVDGAGRGVAGAAIWMAYFADASDCEPKRCATSGPDGEFRVRRDRMGMVWATAAARAPSEFLVVEGRRTVELRLDQDGRELAGRVISATGVAVADASILIVPRSRPDSVRPLISMRSAADGSFGTDQLDVGVHAVVVRAGGFPPCHVVVHGDDPARAMTIELPRGSVLEGIAAIDGAPVTAGLSSRPEWTEDFPLATHFVMARASTDDDGHYRFEPMEPGPARTEAWCRDLATVVGRVDLIDGRSTRWDPPFELGSTIDGRVTDSHGVGLSGWDVSARTSGRSWTTTTRDDGGFTIRGIGDESDAFQIAARPSRAEGAGWSNTTEAFVGARDVLVVARYAFEEAGRIKGRIVDEHGDPASSAYLRVDGVADDERSRSSIYGNEASFGYDVSPGRYSVTVRYGETLGVDAGTHIVERGATVDLGTIRPPLTGRLLIRLRAPDGRVLEPERLSVSGPTGHAEDFERLADGARRTPPLAAVTFTVWARGQTFAPQMQNVVLHAGGETAVDLAVVPATPVRFTIGRVPNSEPHWVTNVQWTIRDAVGKPLPVGSPITLEGDDTAIHTSAFAPGRYAYHFECDGVQSDGEFVVPTPAQSAPIDVRVSWNR